MGYCCKYVAFFKIYVSIWKEDLDANILLLHQSRLIIIRFSYVITAKICVHIVSQAPYVSSDNNDFPQKYDSQT